ncbi:MAG: S-layer homology domain-containing protein [Deltaproteobacteria bacterium]|nr:S-layer homology domain-containing protein [Deltaproteobacteria bacterium]
MRLIEIKRLIWTATVLLVLSGLMTGCGKEPRQASGRLDTPAHHTLRGYDFLEKGDMGEANNSFNLALSLDKKYSQAISGKAIVRASKAQDPRMSKDQREETFKEARKMFKEALSEAKNDNDKRLAYSAKIRIHRMTREPSDDWLEEAEDAYKEAVELDPKGRDADPHLFMARAYRDAYKLQQAQQFYRKVLGMDTNKTGIADEELSLVQKIIRAEPGSMHGRIVAFANSLSRADIAGLFIEELRLDKLYQRGDRGNVDSSFQAPPSGQDNRFEAEKLVRAPEAVDIKDHPMRADIKEVLRLKVAGLEPDPSHRFHPDAKTNRAEFSMMVEDILVKVTGETKLRTKFFGQGSPFRDVRNDLPYFNAVMTVTSRGLIEAKSKVSGMFAPLDPVTGAEALLAIRLLKDELRSYLR